MRIAHIIDSLEIGGAERMAVNYANILATEIAFSGLIVTRKEGNLKATLHPDVSYLFLNKKSKIDIVAVLKLRTWCKDNQINYIHAHSTSFFTAVLLKLIYPEIKLIWHDHYGLNEFLASRPVIALKIASVFFSGIIAVNERLKNWAVAQLYCKNVVYLPNFTTFEAETKSATVLNGIPGKRILCLANLRPQKNHLLLLEVAEKMRLSNPEWSFHLVGKDFNDDYAAKIKQTITATKLEQTVYLYGSRTDTSAIIEQSDIAVLCSDSEGLPVSLLEYGLHKKPVVVTRVGEIPAIIENNTNGLMVAAGNANAFFEALAVLANDADMQREFGKALHRTITEKYTESAVIGKYLEWIATL